jgi:hypothetical protein
VQWPAAVPFVVLSLRQSTAKADSGPVSIQNDSDLAQGLAAALWQAERAVDRSQEPSAAVVIIGGAYPRGGAPCST